MFAMFSFIFGHPLVFLLLPAACYRVPQLPVQTGQRHSWNYLNHPYHARPVYFCRPQYLQCSHFDFGHFSRLLE